MSQTETQTEKKVSIVFSKLGYFRFLITDGSEYVLVVNYSGEGVPAQIEDINQAIEVIDKDKVFSVSIYYAYKCDLEFIARIYDDTIWIYHEAPAGNYDFIRVVLPENTDPALVPAYRPYMLKKLLAGEITIKEYVDDVLTRVKNLIAEKIDWVVNVLK